jgi:hypothetical protein
MDVVRLEHTPSQNRPNRGVDESGRSLNLSPLICHRGRPIIMLTNNRPTDQTVFIADTQDGQAIRRLAACQLTALFSVLG